VKQITTRQGPQAMRHDGKPTVEVIGPEECPILLRRTLLSTRWFKVLLHEFLPNASDRDPHDHPRAFLTLAYQGWYDDIQLCPHCKGDGEEPHMDNDVSGPPACYVCHGGVEGPHGEMRYRGAVKVDRVQAPAVRYRSAKHVHTTQVGPAGCKTVVIMGRLARPWGFWRGGSWYPWRAYDRLFGHGGFRCPE
jgi:hypothetical protein